MENSLLDAYQQHDARLNKKLSDEFEFQYFIYQGGLILMIQGFLCCT